MHLDTEFSWRGGQQQAFYLHQKFLERDIRSEFICQPGSKLGEYLNINNLPFKPVPMNSEFDLWASLKISQFCRSNEIDVIFLHSAHALALGLYCKWFSPHLKIIAVRRVDFKVNKNLFSRYKYNSKKLDQIICISNYIKQVLMNCGVDENKITVIHDGVLMDRYYSLPFPSDIKEKMAIPPKNIVVGTVAAMVGHKDYPNLINAARMVIDVNPQITFIAVGDGPDREQIHKLAESRKLQDNFIFTGFREEIGPLFKIFDIFVLASQQEGLGSSILDAKAAGLPVVGTDAGGIPEIIQPGEDGIIVPRRNPKILAEAILQLASDEKLRKNMGMQARLNVRKFSVFNNVEKNIGLIRRLLG